MQGKEWISYYNYFRKFQHEEKVLHLYVYCSTGFHCIYEPIALMFELKWRWFLAHWTSHWTFVSGFECQTMPACTYSTLIDLKHKKSIKKSIITDNHEPFNNYKLDIVMKLNCFVFLYKYFSFQCDYVGLIEFIIDKYFIKFHQNSGEGRWGNLGTWI